jgi:hypothetical protein
MQRPGQKRKPGAETLEIRKLLIPFNNCAIPHDGKPRATIANFGPNSNRETVQFCSLFRKILESYLCARSGTLRNRQR